MLERRVVSEARPDGTGDLYGMGVPPGRVAAITRFLDKTARSLKAGGDPRSMDQIRADIYLDLLQGTQVAGGQQRAMVDITVDLATLVGLEEKAAEIPGYGPVIADIARQVAQEQEKAGWRWAVTDHNNRVVHTGITTRRPTTAQKRHVQARFRYCVFPGCRSGCRWRTQHHLQSGAAMPSPPSGQTRSTLATHHPTQRQPHLAQPTRTHLHHQRPIALAKA